MIGPKEKLYPATKIESPGVESGELNLKSLPKYVCYRAALLREKQSLRLMLALVCLSFTVLYISARIEIYSLQEMLRLKEYILAPGVVDFTPAAPQSIPDSYVADAVNDFVSDLGNVSPSTIDEQYASVKRFMSDKLKIEFDLDTSSWIEQVKKEDIAQILSVTERKIKADDNGWFSATIKGRAEFYAEQSYLGHEDQVIEMTMKLMPPASGKRWYLQIESLNWNRESTYQTKKKITRNR